MLDALADPQHPDHAEITDWLDEYDPNEIDKLPLNAALGRLAARRNTARIRLTKRSCDEPLHLLRERRAACRMDRELQTPAMCKRATRGPARSVCGRSRSGSSLRLSSVGSCDDCPAREPAKKPFSTWRLICPFICNGDNLLCHRL